MGHAARRRPRTRRDRAVRRILRHRQDHVRRGGRGRPGHGPVRGGPVHGRRQVRRRDREEPGADLHRGLGRQRGAAVRRGRRDLRQALGGEGLPRQARQHGIGLPAPADGVVRRHRRPHHQPARQPRRGVHPPPGRDRGLPGTRRRPAPGPVGTVPGRPAAPGRRPRSRLLRGPVRTGRGLHPGLRRDGRLLRGRVGRTADHEPGGDGGRPGVPQARPPGPNALVPDGGRRKSCGQT